MPKMTHWQDRKIYSIAHDTIMSRVSGFDENSEEHWMMVQAGNGYLKRRNEALIIINESIENGDFPGELKTSIKS